MSSKGNWTKQFHTNSSVQTLTHPSTHQMPPKKHSVLFLLFFVMTIQVVCGWEWHVSMTLESHCSLMLLFGCCFIIWWHIWFFLINCLVLKKTGRWFGLLALLSMLLSKEIHQKSFIRSVALFGFVLHVCWVERQLVPQQKLNQMENSTQAWSQGLRHWEQQGPYAVQPDFLLLPWKCAVAQSSGVWSRKHFLLTNHWLPAECGCKRILTPLQSVLQECGIHGQRVVTCIVFQKHQWSSFMPCSIYSKKYLMMAKVAKYEFCCSSICLSKGCCLVFAFWGATIAFALASSRYCNFHFTECWWMCLGATSMQHFASLSINDCLQGSCESDYVLSPVHP